MQFQLMSDYKGCPKSWKVFTFGPILQHHCTGLARWPSFFILTIDKITYTCFNSLEENISQIKDSLLLQTFGPIVQHHCTGLARWPSPSRKSKCSTFLSLRQAELGFRNELGILSASFFYWVGSFSAFPRLISIIEN